MKDLKRILKNRRCIIFLDLEATQLTHEMIQIGAIKTYLNDDLVIRKVMKPFELYVKPKHKVGKLVTDLTGITDYTVRKEGVTYRSALQSFYKYCGKDLNDALIFVYGNSDGSIFRASAENNMDASMQETTYIIHHIFDFCAFASRYIKGDDGNPLSLSRLLALFGIPFDGQAHSALADARNLMHLYQAFLQSPSILKREYKKVLAKHSNKNSILGDIVSRLIAGETITPESFDEMIEGALK